MASVRRRGDRVRVSLEPFEVALVQDLSAQVLELLGDPAGTTPGDGGATGSLQELLEISLEPIETPEDPVLLRLLPDAYADDGEAAGEFRRLTDADLRATKRGSLSQLATDLSGAEPVLRNGGVRLDLDEEQAAAWLTALNDIRLALGTRLGVTEDMDDEVASLSVDSRRYAELATYDWLTGMQDAMLRALQRG
jgi:hypothetical protein